jgi:hypothetical protein
LGGEDSKNSWEGSAQDEDKTPPGSAKGAPQADPIEATADDELWQFLRSEWVDMHKRALLGGDMFYKDDYPDRDATLRAVKRYAKKAKGRYTPHELVEASLKVLLPRTVPNSPTGYAIFLLREGDRALRENKQAALDAPKPRKPAFI